MGFNREKLKRSELLLGSSAMECLEKSTVLVIGLGAVGSHVIEALARIGVGRLKLVDFDSVGLSNFNRQLLALESTLGRLKIDAARDRLLDINPDMTVKTFNLFCHGDTLETVIQGRVDCVVDAMDSLNPKVTILCELVRRGVPVVSSMGAARRTDPGAVTVGDISQTIGCPLARMVRKRLRRRGVDSGIRCVYSTQPAPKDSISGELEENVMNAGRQRNPMGSLPMITGIFGYTAALEAVKIILTGQGDPAAGLFP